MTRKPRSMDRKYSKQKQEEILTGWKTGKAEGLNVGDCAKRAGAPLSDVYTIMKVLGINPKSFVKTTTTTNPRNMPLKNKKSKYMKHLEQQYTKEWWRMRSEGLSAKAAAKELGIPRRTLSCWSLRNGINMNNLEGNTMNSPTGNVPAVAAQPNVPIKVKNQYRRYNLLQKKTEVDKWRELRFSGEGMSPEKAADKLGHHNAVLYRWCEQLELDTCGAPSHIGLRQWPSAKLKGKVVLDLLKTGDQTLESIAHCFMKLKFTNETDLEKVKSRVSNILHRLRKRDLIKPLKRGVYRGAKVDAQRLSFLTTASEAVRVNRRALLATDLRNKLPAETLEWLMQEFPPVKEMLIEQGLLVPEPVDEEEEETSAVEETAKEEGCFVGALGLPIHADSNKKLVAAIEGLTERVERVEKKLGKKDDKGSANNA